VLKARAVLYEEAMQILKPYLIPEEMQVTAAATAAPSYSAAVKVTSDW